MSHSAQRLARLLDQVIEQARDTDPQHFHLGRHAHWLKSPAQLQGLSGLSVALSLSAGEPVWLRLERPNPEPLPAPGLEEQLVGLIHTQDDPDGPPPHLDEVMLARRLALTVTDRSADAVQRIETRVSVWVSQALADHLAAWTQWADVERARRRSVALYSELFALKQQIEATQTTQALELVWGLGVSAWQLPTKPDKSTSAVQYPLITQALEVVLEEGSLALLLRPRTLAPRLAFDVWGSAGLPMARETERRALEALAACEPGLHPSTPGAFESVWRVVAGTLHERGRYLPTPAGGVPVWPEPGPDLHVSDAWVLLARPRSNSYLHEDIQRLKDQLASLDTMPEGVDALVTPSQDRLAASEPLTLRGRSGLTRPPAGPAGLVHELFFPLPYNSEQVSIVDWLERSHGVAVQGPPGTGKTHTIANIVCHYLAQGRRVLVSAKGDRALEVLQSKIPAPVRPLTVAVLAGDREGLRQFRSAIEAITHTVTQLHPDEVRARLHQAHSDIHRAHSELALLDRRIAAIAQQQLSDIEFEGDRWRPQRMAEHVAQGEARYAWWTDRPTLAPEHAPPLSALEVARLREVRRALGPDMVRVAAGIPSCQDLPAADDVGAMHQALLTLHQLAQDTAQGDLPALLDTSAATLSAAQTLRDLLADAQPQVLALERAEQAWPVHVRQRCAQAGLASERTALLALLDDLAVLTRERAAFLRLPVVLPPQDELSPALREVLERAASTGRPFGRFNLGAAELKARVAHIRVAGLAPVTPADWAHTVRCQRLHERCVMFRARWQAIAPALGLPELPSDAPTLLGEIDIIAAALRPALALSESLDAVLPLRLAEVFAPVPALPPSVGSTDIARLLRALDRHLAGAELNRAQAQHDSLRQRIAQAPEGELRTAWLDWFAQQLGQPDVPVDVAVAQYVELLGAWRRLEALLPAYATLEALTTRIAEAGAPQWAARLRQACTERQGDDPHVPADWREAWQWARLRTHVDSIDAHAELAQLTQQRQALEHTLARRYEDVVAQSAWLAMRVNASPKVLSALARYQTAVRLIGKGTGAHALRHRQDAQQAMQEAQSAVPCWIMSHARVSEMLPAQIGSFDLVIVDEASQSDLWALPVLLRGRKLLIVGDDKQVSPEAGGFLAASRVQALRERFLVDQPHAAVLTPLHSLYDMASSVFAASKVMLREHFRCAAPIIAYSNHTFYDGAIQPLRVPTASERLDPPLIDLFVPSGRRDGRDINHDEAQAIADEIAAVLADSRCAGRSLGVISLLGFEQARYIDHLVRTRCDAAELQRRQFECGDARQFQGSERDVLFLSLVVSPGACKALSGNVFEQRFNVATSRARDRMVLVRSVTMADLSPLDLRQGLLAHFSADTCAASASAHGDDAQAALRALCESGFEREVLDALLTRGYHVQPQVRVGSYRIDLVVEGEGDRRLAVECDGDEFHGPDRWAADMQRQRVLERAGWVFWRCFASTWRRRPDQVLADLVQTLQRHGIAPLGRDAQLGHVLAQRVWHPPGLA